MLVGFPEDLLCPLYNIDNVIDVFATTSIPSAAPSFPPLPRTMLLGSCPSTNLFTAVRIVAECDTARTSYKSRLAVLEFEKRIIFAGMSNNLVNPVLNAVRYV